jgi:hypothetical protein
MSLSYVVMLIAFYVDNGKQLPIWKAPPQSLYWLLPVAVAAHRLGAAVPPIGQDLTSLR